MKLENIAHNAKQTVGNAIAIISLATIMSIPAIIDEIYVRNTTKSLKEYNIHIDKVITKGAEDFIQVSGDTTGTLVHLRNSGFEENKNYHIHLRKYGFNIIETYRIEGTKEIKK